MNMLDVLKEQVCKIENFNIVKIKELSSKYTITFEYEGDTAKAELPKMCTPNCHNEVAHNTIITAMSTIYFNRGDFVKAKEWLNKKMC